MFSNIKIIGTLGVFAFFFGIFVYMKVEIMTLKHKNITLTLSIEKQNLAITQWQQVAAYEQTKLTHLEQAAAEEMAIANQRVDAISREKISQDCHQAMQWGIQKAKELSQ